MSMQLRIVHTTGFEYDGKAVASLNQARLTPASTPEQIVVHHRIEVSPKPWTHSYRDYFGTTVTAFEVVDPHDSMTVTATSTVQVNRPAPAAAELRWDDLGARDVADRWIEYLMTCDLTRPSARSAAAAAEVAASSALPDDAARAICDAARAENRSGELVHRVLGRLRSVGIPARYVSGYVHPEAAPRIGESATGEPHSWVEWWDGAWKGYDPTNGRAPDSSYVVVATGRDYTDVKPISGIYSGAGTSTMFVSVEVTRLA